MFYVLQNETVAARKRCPILLTDSATGTTGQSGIAISNIYAYVSINGGAFAGGAGTIAEVNFGQYYYQFDASEINTLGLAGIHITAPGCRDYDAIVQVAAFDMYSAAGAGLTAGDVWSYGGGRTTTGGIADTVVNPVDVTTASMTGIANTVWDTDVSTFTSPSAGYDLTQAASGGAGISAYDVWQFDASTFINTTEAGGLLNAAYLAASSADSNANAANTQTVNIAGQVWSEDLGTMGYSAGTAGSILYDLSLGGGAGISAYDVWNYVLSDANTAENDLTNINSKVNTIDLNVSTIYGDVGTINTNTQAANIALAVWSDNIAAGPNAPYASGTAGTILYDLSLGGGGGITAGDVWSYVDRTITGGIADTVQLVSTPVNVSTSSMSGIANSVWDFVITGFGQTGSAALYSTQTLFTTGNIETYVANQTPQDVWTYSGIEGRTITGGIADTVTTLTNRSGFAITGGTITTVSDKTGYSLSASQTFDLTGNVTGNVSGSVGSVTNPVSVSTASMSSIAGTVWTNASRTITGGIADTVTSVTNGVTVTTNNDKTGYSLSGTQSFNLTGNITGSVSGSVGSVSGNVDGNVVGSVASVTNPVTITTGNMASIASSTWNFATRTLTSGGGSGISAYDVWNFVLSDANTAEVDLVQAASGAGLTAGDVWTYGSRTITGGIADTVTSVSNGVTVTTNNDKSGYALSTAGVNAVQSGLSTLTQAQVGTEVDASLADVGLTTTVTGRIDDSISSRLASSSYTAPPTTSAIAGTVWSYGTRTLTSGSGISAADVWNYNISGITTSGSAGKQLNDASVSGSVVTIVNGPYKLNSTAEGTDGRIDILQGSVQTINLSLVNGFGQPFNVTGYTLSVDIYDVASTLVESYVPVVNYANGGNISFDIDTTVTGVIGTYNLIVSLTNGDVVQVGPITILVRPL